MVGGLFALALAMEAVDPSFPALSSTFSMTQAFWYPPVASGPANATRNLVWDINTKRFLYYAHFPHGVTGQSTDPAFEIQLKRCDLAAQAFWDVKGDPTKDPSTYTCYKRSGHDMAAECSQEWPPYWAPISPGKITFNGTDVINGVSCNRFEIHDGMGQQTFWATANAPCRSTNARQREDYQDFNATTPPASAYDGPAWLKGLKCKSLPPAAEQ